VPRQRDANRDKAKEIYLAHKGDIALVEIARQLGMATEDSDGSGTVRGWKSKDKWDDDLYGTLQKKRTERSEQEKPRSKRSVKNASNNAGISKSGENPVGSNAETNIKRRGAPIGNQNALNNRGGIGAKPKNKFARKTGEYETIYYSDLDPEELEFLNKGKDHFADKYHQQLMLIQDLTLREMRMRRDIMGLLVGLCITVALQVFYIKALDTKLFYGIILPAQAQWWISLFENRILLMKYRPNKERNKYVRYVR